MATRKYISFSNLTKFFDNLKNMFATKIEVDAKANKSHTHSIANVTNLQSALDGKASTSHGAHVAYSTTAPTMDGSASVGTASTVARSDHKHPTDTSRAAQTSLDSHTSNVTTHITSTERTNWNTAYTHSQSAHAPSDAEPNQNAFSNIKVGDVTIAADIKTDTLTLVAGNNVTITPDANGDSITISSKDTNTTYSAGTGISLSGTQFSNSGVRSIATGSSNGTISVNTNGTSANVAVKGLGSAAYTASSAYDAAGTAQTKADAALASAKTYADGIKSDLLNGAGAAYDTLKELGNLIDENVDAIEALETVAASKANSSDLTSHTSNKSNPHGVTLAQLGVTATASEINKMDGITATTAELNIMDGVTATTAEINYLDGVTSSIQTQLDGKASSGHTHKYAGSSSAGGAATSANKLNTDAGSATQPVYFSNGVPVATTYTLGKSVPSNAVFTDTHYSSKNVVGATNATSNTATALTNGNVYINSVENGAVTSSHKISGAGATTVTTDANGNIVITSTDNNTTYNAAGSSLGLVKSGGDVTISSGVITINDDSHNHTIANIDNLQSSLDAKQATVSGGASTITSSNLTANRALISNGSGKVAVSAVTSTELGYLDGVTSNVQTQLDGKSSTSHTHNTTYIPDTRNDNQTPIWYISNYPNQVITEFKNTSTIGLSGSAYCKLTTYVQWANNSGGYPSQEAIVDGRLYTRQGTADTTWSNWKTNIDSGNIASQSVASASSAASCTGNSATATKLQTARTIGLSTGATGTATSFNGTGNITIPVTDVKESYLSWGGKNLVGSVSPVGASLSSEHSANRLAYLNPAAIKVEYSNDAGSTWTDSGLGNSAKINFVTTSNGISVGSNSTVTTNHRTRVTLTAQNGTTGYVYTRPRKMLINVSTAGHGLTVTIEAKTGASDANWTTLGTYELNGWSGWNDIPMGISTFGGGTNQTGNYWYVRLTFATTSVSSSYTTTKSSIIGLRLFGDTCWTRTSNMGETGHLYSYDSSQNATFPANVTATTLNGTTFSGSGVATLAEVKTYLGI